MKRWYFKVKRSGVVDPEKIWEDAETQEEAETKVRGEISDLEEIQFIESKDIV